MYYLKAKTENGDLNVCLGSPLLGEIEGGQAVSNRQAKDNLHINILNNVCVCAPVMRWDMLRFEQDDMERLKNGLELRAYFENEVIKSDFAYQKPGAWNYNNKVTTFRPQKKGIYDVKAHIRIIPEFAELPDSSGFNTSMELILMRNEKAYSYLAHDKGISINKQPPQAEPHIVITELDYCLNGSDHIFLDLGDEICLSIFADFNLYSSVRLTGLSVYGNFSAAWQGCKVGEENPPDNNFYNTY